MDLYLVALEEIALEGLEGKGLKIFGKKAVNFQVQ